MTPTPDTAAADPREDFGDRLVDRIRGSRATFVLASLLVGIHLLVGLVPYTRGRAEWWGVLVGRRGPRLLSRFGAMRTRSLDRGDSLYRLVSAAFLHADGLHLLVNVMSLLVVGRIVEAIYGPVRMLWVFLLSAVAGASASWLLGATHTSVGASGGVFGLLGTMIGRVAGYFEQRQSQAHERARWQHEAHLAGLQIQARREDTMQLWNSACSFLCEPLA